MIPCICVDDTEKPADIPLSSWVKLGERYHIVDAKVVLPQGMLAFKLHELQLDMRSYPYQFFASNRFAIDIDRMDDIIEMVMEPEVDEDIEQMINTILKDANISRAS
jgi:hypothetical protein